MDSLKMSYDEVMTIPYARLMMMQKDKLRVTTGQKVVKGSGMDMLRRRMNNG